MGKNSQSKDQRDPVIVGFQGRLFATIIDLFLSMLLLLPFVSMEFPPEVTEILQQFQSGQISDIEANARLKEYMVYGGGLANSFSNLTYEFIISGVVIIIFWIYRSGTPGKMFLKMKIVNASDYGKPTKIRLVARYLGYLVSGVPFFLGFFWIAFDKKRQGWHDKLAGTIVVYDGEPDVKRYMIAITAMIIAIVVMMKLGL